MPWGVAGLSRLQPGVPPLLETEVKLRPLQTSRSPLRSTSRGAVVVETRVEHVVDFGFLAVFCPQRFTVAVGA